MIVARRCAGAVTTTARTATTVAGASVHSASALAGLASPGFGASGTDRIRRADARLPPRERWESACSDVGGWPTWPDTAIAPPSSRQPEYLRPAYNCLRSAPPTTGVGPRDRPTMTILASSGGYEKLKPYRDLMTSDVYSQRNRHFQLDAGNVPCRTHGCEP